LKDFAPRSFLAAFVSCAHSLIAAMAASEISLRPLTILEHQINRGQIRCIPLMPRLIAHLRRLVSRA
jgi:HAMP domain-containing protein